MKLTDFEIGQDFYVQKNEQSGMITIARWKCTDKGTRTVAAVQIDPKFSLNLYSDGPPYLVEERIFDEIDMEDCRPATMPLEEFLTYEEKWKEVHAEVSHYQKEELENWFISHEYQTAHR